VRGGRAEGIRGGLPDVRGGRAEEKKIPEMRA